jgi:hypothetical protein
VELRKTKRPSGFWSCDATEITEDRHGAWLFLRTGRPWHTQNDTGELPFDVVVLLAPDRWLVTWWCDDPADRRLELDVCLPPVQGDAGWSFVDLELDPVRHENGFVEVEDHDEFEAACRNGWIAPEEATIALETAARMEAALRERVEPWGEEGWIRLQSARS